MRLSVAVAEKTQSTTHECSKSDVRFRLGFCDGDCGTHSSRTLMLSELSMLLESRKADAVVADYRRAVMVDNVLGKRTHSNRENTIARLKTLYGLEPSIPVFRALRTFWTFDVAGRPLLALLCAFARDPLLRMTSGAVLDARFGTFVASKTVEKLLLDQAPGRFSESTEKAIVARVLSSWTQSGHLSGHSTKVRTRVQATPGSTAFALFLAHLEGRRAQRLFDSVWGRILDTPMSRLLEFASEASRRGWINLRRAGGIVDVRFPELLTRQEEALLYDQ